MNPGSRSSLERQVAHTFGDLGVLAVQVFFGLGLVLRFINLATNLFPQALVLNEHFSLDRLA